MTAERHGDAMKPPTPTHTTPEPISAVPRTRQTTERPPLPWACTCGARWSGASTAHCGACHHTFTGVSAFDQHRRHGECVYPPAAGLVLRDRTGYTAWGLPGEFPAHLHRPATEE